MNRALGDGHWPPHRPQIPELQRARPRSAPASPDQAGTTRSRSPGPRTGRFRRGKTIAPQYLRGRGAMAARIGIESTPFATRLCGARGFPLRRNRFRVPAGGEQLDADSCRTSPVRSPTTPRITSAMNTGSIPLRCTSSRREWPSSRLDAPLEAPPSGLTRSIGPRTDATTTASPHGTHSRIRAPSRSRASPSSAPRGAEPGDARPVIQPTGSSGRPSIAESGARNQTGLTWDVDSPDEHPIDLRPSSRPNDG